MKIVSNSFHFICLLKNIYKDNAGLTSSMLGFTINFPQILPIRIIPMGPFQGISESIRAADVALAAITSGSCLPSEERTFADTCKNQTKILLISKLMKSQNKLYTGKYQHTWTSWKNPAGKSGRMGLSISRPHNNSRSLGAPSLRINVFGITPWANCFSW